MAAGAERRDRILTAAARLFAEQGVATTTVRMIGEAVGLNSGSLYHHFASKEAIVDTILSSYFDHLFERYRAVVDGSADPRQQLEGLVRESFRSIAEYPEACEIYRNDYKHLTATERFGGLVDATREVQSTWLGVIDAGVHAGVLRDDIDRGLFYRFTRDAIWQTSRWYAPSGPHTIDEIADACLTVVLDGFAAEAPGAPARGA